MNTRFAEQLMELLPDPQPEVESSVTAECPDPKPWSMYDGNSTEVETLEFLYSLVRLVKPKNICIETGTAAGYGSWYIGQALKDNSFGKLYTAEVDDNEQRKAKSLHEGISPKIPVEFCLVAGKSLIENFAQIDFAFLDSGCGGTNTQSFAKFIITKIR